MGGVYGKDFGVRTAAEERLGVSWKARKAGLYKWPTSYVAMDLETTGLDPFEDGIVEIAGVKVVDGEVVDTFQTLVSTTAKLSAEASRVNGITKDMLRGAPGIEEALGSFLKFSADLPMLGHNAKGFDIRFVEHACARIAGAELPREWYDTMELAETVYGRRRMSLRDLCQRCDVTNDEAHRALSDSQATHECYQAMRSLIALVTTEARDFPEPTADGPLSGEVISFTGRCEQMTRHALMMSAVEAGARVSNGVTLKVTTLVDLDGSPSGKVDKANKYRERTGIRIIGAEEYFSMAGLPYDASAEVVGDEPDEPYVEFEAIAEASGPQPPQAQGSAAAHLAPASTPKQRGKGRGATDVVLTVLTVVFSIDGVMIAPKSVLSAALAFMIAVGIFVGRNRRRERLEKDGR